MTFNPTPDTVPNPDPHSTLDPTSNSYPYSCPNPILTLQERQAFGKSLSEFGQIQKAIAESYAEYMAGNRVNLT